MNVFIRTDASVLIGSGHVMRCLALAEGLVQSMEAKVSFICKLEEGHMADWIERCGFQVYHMTLHHWDWEKDFLETQKIFIETGQSPDLIIVDHYKLDYRWESHFKSAKTKMLVIDDLADRRHNCDILIDQNLYLEMEQRYQGIIPDACKLLVGPKYAFLRPEFYEKRKKLRVRNGAVKRMLVFLGGSDPFNTTLKVLHTLSNMSLEGIVIDVVVGASNPNQTEIKSFCQSNSQFAFHVQVNYMAELIANADLAIGAGGITIWERCFLGLPTLTIIQVENQRLSTETVSLLGGAWNLGWDQFLTEFELEKRISEVLHHPELLLEVSAKGMLLMGDPDKHGIALIMEILK